MGLCAAFTSLALLASEAALASFVRAPALGIAVTALVEVRAAYLLGEDVDNVGLLLSWHGTCSCYALKKVTAASVVSLLLVRCIILGLGWKFL